MIRRQASTGSFVANIQKSCCSPISSSRTVESGMIIEDRQSICLESLRTQEKLRYIILERLYTSDAASRTILDLIEAMIPHILSLQAVDRAGAAWDILRDITPGLQSVLKCDPDSNSTEPFSQQLWHMIIGDVLRYVPGQVARYTFFAKEFEEVEAIASTIESKLEVFQSNTAFSSKIVSAIQQYLSIPRMLLTAEYLELCDILDSLSIEGENVIPDPFFSRKTLETIDDLLRGLSGICLKSNPPSNPNITKALILLFVLVTFDSVRRDLYLHFALCRDFFLTVHDKIAVFDLVFRLIQRISFDPKLLDLISLINGL